METGMGEWGIVCVCVCVCVCEREREAHLHTNVNVLCVFESLHPCE